MQYNYSFEFLPVISIIHEAFGPLDLASNIGEKWSFGFLYSDAGVHVVSLIQCNVAG